MDSPKTMFVIYLEEDDLGRVTVKSDHYGPGFNCYEIGTTIIQNLHDIADNNPDVLRVQSLYFLPRPQ